MESKLLTVLQFCNGFSIFKQCLSFPVLVFRTAVSLSYRIIGDGPAEPERAPLILFHGLLENKRHWESFAKVMLNTMKRSVITVDLRNHGDSPHTSSHKYEELVEDILKLYDKLDIDKACVIGNSMGGKAAMCLSLIEPQKVSGLIVVETSPITTTPAFRENMPKYIKAMKSVDFKNPKTVRKARKRAKEQLKDVIRDDIIMKVILSNITIKPDNTIGWTCNLEVLTKHFKDIASFPSSMKGKRYRGPTLFIGGQMSDYIPPDDLTGIRAFFPYAVIQYVPKAGHYVQFDDSKTFLELIMTFFRNTP